MSADGTSIYTGPWVNWSHGLVLGSTVTLSARNSTILTSFIATFVTIVGVQLWKILCIIIHQSRASQEPQDGLYHQHQNVFRNSNTPGGAAWSFILQSWCWWGRVHHSMMRSLPWALFSILYIVLFAVLSVFGSSEVAKAAGQERLLRSSRCGYWDTNGSEPGLGSFAAKVLRGSQNAATYARDCYDGSVDTLRCNRYATPYIKWEEKPADCPFEDVICKGNNTYQMDTGLVDSHHDLGINTPAKDRLKYRRVTTCSVLVQKGYADINDSSPFVTWNYGPYADKNVTFIYKKNTLGGSSGYTVNVVHSDVGISIPSSWEPVSPLNRTDADITLIFIASNSVMYDTPVDDPVFSAHAISNLNISDSEGQKVVLYEADYYLGVIGCASQHQVCNGDTCTALSARAEAFSSSSGLTMTQRNIFGRLGFVNVYTGIVDVIDGRSATALRAAETARGIHQASLPSNQWQIELSSWFDTGLASLQFALREYATPGKTVPGVIVQQPKTPVDLAMCDSQKTQTTDGTISFSVLGLAIILIVGALLIFTGFILETVMSWIGLKSHLNWVLDDKLQLQRMVFEGRGVRWNTEGAVPVTEAGERFPSVTGSAESESLMSQGEKQVGANLREVR